MIGYEDSIDYQLGGGGHFRRGNLLPTGLVFLVGKDRNGRETA